jgi:hypothetical protein
MFTLLITQNKRSEILNFINLQNLKIKENEYTFNEKDKFINKILVSFT